MTPQEAWRKHVNPAFVDLLGTLGFGRQFVRARDVWLWDDRDRKYLDALAAFGAMNLGHGHPRLRRRVEAFFAEEAVNLNHLGPQVHAARLAERLATKTGLDIALFSSSGAEGVEAGLKVARAATRRPGFLSCQGGFHGTNLGTLSVMDGARWREPFEPLLAGCERVPYGDLGAAARALETRAFAAFVVEPILGEGGVVVPPSGYLAEVHALCRRTGTVLVVDEVQTGLGRTGAWSRCQAEGVVPDVLVLAKSLGGGLVPIAATMVDPELHRRAYGSVDKFDLHSSTFAGYALGAAVALEALDVIDDEKLVDQAQARGEQLRTGLERQLAGHPFVRAIRGAGLLVGIELGPTERGFSSRVAPGLVAKVSKDVFGQWLALRLLECGVVAQPASQQWDVLRLEPPLTLGAAEVDTIVDAVAGILLEYRGLTPLLQDVAMRLGAQWARGWTFR